MKNTQKNFKKKHDVALSYTDTWSYLKYLTDYWTRCIKHNKKSPTYNDTAYIWHYFDDSIEQYLYDGEDLNFYIFLKLETHGLIYFSGKHKYKGKMMNRWSLTGGEYWKEKNTYVRKPIPQYIKTQLLFDSNFECKICSSSLNLEIDHIHPVSKGGTNDINNLQVLCRVCNRKKHAKTPND